MADTIWRKAKLYNEQHRYQEALELMEQTISLLESIDYPELAHYRREVDDMLRVVHEAVS